MKIPALALPLVVLVASSSAFAQKGVTWKWAGDWEALTQGWKCPGLCLQRHVQVLRPGKTPVDDTLVYADLNGGGARFQYVVLGRNYTWTKLTSQVAFAGVSNPTQIKAQRTTGLRVLSGAGTVLGLSPNYIEASSVVMDDAARDFLEWEAQTAKSSGASAKGGSGGSTGLSPERLAEIRKQNEKDLAAFHSQMSGEAKRLLASAEASIARKDYKAALLEAQLSAVAERTPAAAELEQRVRKLIEEEEAARKSVGIVDDPMTHEQLVTAPDRKALFGDGEPYPNPYDTRTPDRPVQEDPYDWKDCPKGTTDVAVLKELTRAAREANDGYRLLQLAIWRANLAPDFEPLDALLNDVYRIARHNRDPWLMLHLAQTYRGVCRERKEADYPMRRLPAHLYREGYRMAVLRGDAAALDFLIQRQQRNTPMVIPEVAVSRIYKDAQRLRGR